MNFEVIGKCLKDKCGGRGTPPFAQKNCKGKTVFCPIVMQKPFRRSEGLAIRIQRRDVIFLAGPLHPRIQCIAQTIAEKGKAHHDERYGNRGRKQHPRLSVDRRLSFQE